MPGMGDDSMDRLMKSEVESVEMKSLKLEGSPRSEYSPPGDAQPWRGQQAGTTPLRATASVAQRYNARGIGQPFGFGGLHHAQGTAPGAVAVVPLRSLKTYLVRDIQRARSWVETPVFVLWLVCITLVVVLSGVANPSSYNVLYQLEESHHWELETERFMKLHTISEFWDWMDSVAKHLWLRDIAPSTYPLGYVLMRQFRVKNSSYGIPGVISTGFREQLPPFVLGDWDDSRVSVEPYGPSGMWVPDSQKDLSINVLTADTQYHSYPDPEKAFSIPLSFTANLSEIQTELAFLRGNHWIDLASRLVVVDVLTFNPYVNSFALNHMFIELFASGSMVAMTKAYPFQLLVLESPTSKFILALDFGVLLGSLMTIRGMVMSIWLNKKMGAPWVNVWDVFEAILMVVFGIAYYFRIQLWLEGSSLNGNDNGSGSVADADMFIKLTDYGYKYERASTYLAIAATMSWLRVLRLIAHNERLGVLSATIRYASGQLISLFVIYTFVLIAYSIGATALFGADFRPMSSISMSFGYLARLTVSAEISTDWEILSDIHPQMVWMFLGSFMIISWLILLNMVLAIVSGSFALVQSTSDGKVVSWSFNQLYSDMKKAKKELYGRKMFQFRGKQGEQAKRITTVQIIREHAHRSPEGYKREVTGDEWVGMCKEVYAPYEARNIFSRAEKEPHYLLELNSSDDDLRPASEASDGDSEEESSLKSGSHSASPLLHPAAERQDSHHDDLQRQVSHLESQLSHALALLHGISTRIPVASAEDPGSIVFDVLPTSAREALPRIGDGGPHTRRPEVSNRVVRKGKGKKLSASRDGGGGGRAAGGRRDVICWQCGERAVSGKACGACGAGGQQQRGAANGNSSFFSSHSLAESMHHHSSDEGRRPSPQRGAGKPGNGSVNQRTTSPPLGSSRKGGRAFTPISSRNISHVSHRESHSEDERNGPAYEHFML